jgi:hypothetical protein
MKASLPEIPDNAAFMPSHEIGKGYYFTFVQPVMSRSGKKVGVIRVFEDVSPEERVLRQSTTFNALVALVLWAVTVGFAAIFLRSTRVAEITCAQIPLLHESDTVEFKSSLRWNYRANRPDREMEKAVVKTVTGFFNSYQGGNLIIGIDDQGQVLGLEPDYSTLTSRPNRDGFEQALRNVLVNAFGERPCAAWMKVRFCSLQDKEICLVKVTSAADPIYPRERGVEDATLYVRLGNTTTPLNAREAVAYSRERWPGVSLRRSYFSQRPYIQPTA